MSVSRTRLFARLVITLLIVHSFAGSAIADEPVDAEAYVGRATQHFKNHDYTAAAEALSRAYELDPRPLFLFNIGQAYRLADRPSDAIAWYEKFLADAPQHPLAPEAKGYLQTMRALLAERQLVLAAQEAARAEKERAQKAVADAQAAEEKLRQERKSKAAVPVYKRPWFWVVIGGAVATIVVAGAVGGYYANQPPATDGGFQVFHF